MPRTVEIERTEVVRQLNEVNEALFSLRQMGRRLAARGHTVNRVGESEARLMDRQADLHRRLDELERTVPAAEPWYAR